GMMKPKTHHSLKMTKTGYIDSDRDVLYNDSFTVPTPSESEEETVKELQEELSSLEKEVSVIKRKIASL
ncbi:MAG: hypothetical protein ACOC1X_02720, partial [Promethearchaeota archaeon]